jgi:hypothetical protein
MRKVWIAMAVCAGAAGFLAWGSSQPSQAAMMISGDHANTSMVDQVKARKRAKAAAPQCNNYLLMKCCTAKGKETCTPGPM